MVRASKQGLPTVRDMARGWRWGSRPLVPGSAEEHRPLPAPPREFRTEWARTPAVRGFRAVAQAAGLKPLVWSEVAPQVTGLDNLVGVRGPVLFVANHTSHLDAPLVLCSLPPSWRHETLVAAAADYFFEDWWRAFGTALIFGTVPLDRTGGPTASAPSATPQGLLAEGWSLLFFPEGTRSPDGQLASFKTGAARLSQAEDIPIVPIGIRGSFAAMPRGRAWPVAGRPRVSVRYGSPMRALPGESAKKFTTRISTEIVRLADEDRTTWWDSMRRASGNGAAAGTGAAVRAGAGAGGGAGANGSTPTLNRDSANWRRVWASTEPVGTSSRSTPWD